ncbi:hypothetical protein LCGC14_3158080 [marine sediment metagenome]|uniref:Uncharacterized protein n=1 Tax=marine sediment metagenome TaxID=412755 RepID=A0A0F8VS23_9ZZZZ|nr:hypothetical protein [Candidatus Scalindua sp.]
MRGSLGQIDKKFSEKTADKIRTNSSPAFLTGDEVPVASVWNIQVASEPTHGDRFFLTPYCYRYVSAGGESWANDSTDANAPEKNTVYGTRHILLGGDISATASAVSAEINLACAGSEGATAITAVGSKSDIAATATIPGNKIECYVVGEGTAGDTVATVTTAGNVGDPLPEGYTSYKTSAGNDLRVQGPAEANFMRITGRHPSAKV